MRRTSSPTPSPTESDEPAEEQERTPKKKKAKVFSFNWLENRDFKEWVLPIKESKNKCKCKACNKILVCGKTELQRHAASAKHKERMKNINTSQKLNILFQRSTDEKVKLIEHKKQVANAEIVLSSYIAEHNTALSNIEHLVPVLKNIFPTCKIAQDLQLSRKKCTAIIKNVIAKTETDELIDILKSVS